MLSKRASDGNRGLFNQVFPNDHIAPMDYDAIYLVGLLEPLHPLILSNHKTLLPDQISQERSGLFRRKGAADIPKGCTIGTVSMFRAAWQAHFEASKAAALLALTGTVPVPPCFLAVNPLISAGLQKITGAVGKAKTAASGRKAGYIETCGQAYAAALRRGSVPVLARLADEGLRTAMPSHVRLLAQPEQTKKAGCMTVTSLMAGAEKYYGDGETFGAQDVLHANRKYGELLLKSLFAAMETERAKA